MFSSRWRAAATARFGGESSMKAYVITNKENKVVGHIHFEESQSADIPIPGRPTPGLGQKVHEIDFPSELVEMKDTDRLHEALEKHLRDRRLIG
jgi:hypothetical protein